MLASAERLLAVTGDAATPLPDLRRAAARDRVAAVGEHPPGLDLDAVRTHLLALPRVLGVHDLHASQLTSGLPVLTAHVVIEYFCFYDGYAPQVLDQLQACLAGHFPLSVEHSTSQLEMATHTEHEASAHT